MPDIFIEKQIEHKDQNEPQVKSVNNPNPKESIGNHVGLFSTFVKNPLGIKITEQQEDERVLLFIRRDFTTNGKWIAFGLFLIIFPFFIPSFISPINFILVHIPKTVIIMITIFYYVIVAGYIFSNFISWFYDIGIITQERSIDIDFYNISYVSVATAKSQDIKDVRYFQRGIFESLFDYGDVTLAVESSNEVLVFDKTPRPAEVVTLLSNLVGGHQSK